MMLSRFASMFMVTLCAAASAWAQEYPVRPIRVLTSGMGGSSEIATRLYAPALSAIFGQQLVVEGRPGPLAAETVAKAPPDGYTLLMAGNVFVTAHLLQPSPFDPVGDFAPIAMVASAPSVVTVHPTLPVKSAKELIALARVRPGDLNYASGSAGSTTHLSGELFKSLARVNIVRIAYKGAGAAISDLMTGQVQVAFYSPGSVSAHVQSGRLKAIAVSSSQPSALVPGVPTVAATGLPGYEVLSVDALFAPAKTPAAVVNRLSQELMRILNRPEIKEKFLHAGGEVVANTPEQLAVWLKSEIAKWAKVIKEARIQAE
jgi:tripartite-type tricarboxylate transporter receptor subunit TctC